MGVRLNWLTTVKSLMKGFNMIDMIRTALGNGRKLGEAAKNLIDGSEKRICRLTFKFWTSHVIERRSKVCKLLAYVLKNTFLAAVVPI